MGKRKAQGGIVAAFAKAKDVASGVKLPDLEVKAPSMNGMLDVFVESCSKDYDHYRDSGAKISAQLLRAAQQRQARGAAAAASPDSIDTNNSIDLDDAEHAATGAILDARAARWQKSAAIVLRQLSNWAGTHIALQQPLQEQLLHIVLNHDLHPDPLISVNAYRVLLKNLAAHPPVRAVDLPGADNKRQLEINELCWTPLTKAARPDEDDKRPRSNGAAAAAAAAGASRSTVAGLVGSRFDMLQQLVSNAVLMVTGDVNSSDYTQRASSSSTPQQPSQGKALMLLYLVQLLQSDCSGRLAVFEQHMQPSQLLSGEEQQRIRSRAGTVLENSLLYRLIDTGGGWVTGETVHVSHGRHRLIRDLLVLVASSSDAAAAVAASSPSPPPAAAPAGQAAAGSSGGGTLATPAGAAGAAAAMVVQPVQRGDLIDAARRLLLLLLQLYSGCEAAGVYGSETHGAHNPKRGKLAAQNDRYWLDNVMLRALGANFESSGAGWTLQVLRPDVVGPAAATAALQRLLAFLPPVHRQRLLALAVAEAISSRCVGDNSTPNNHINALHEYFVDQGKGHAEFRRADALEVMKALADRLDWASKEVLGGKEAFALLVASLINTALSGRQLPQGERDEFVAKAQVVLDYVVEHSRPRLAKAGCGASDVVVSLGLAMQQLRV